VGVREQDLLLRQYIAAQRRLRTGLAEWIRRWFLASQSFRDADADRFVEQVVPVATGAQRSLASLSWAVQVQLLADMVGGPAQAPPIDAAAVSGRALRGVDPEVVYRRPFSEIYKHLHEDKTLTEAVTAGERRAKLTGLTDLELASRAAAREVARSDGRVRWMRRRLTGDENCGLCVIASTQRYRVDELMPIDPGCDCVPVPVEGERDPGQVVDQELLDAAHAAIAQRFGQVDRTGRQLDYRKILLVRTHGELGPVLTVARHRFTGPDEIASPRG
jgi:hypothetical protein